MTNSKQVFQDLVQRMTINETRSEKEAIAFLVLEELCKISRMDVLAEKTIAITENLDKAYQSIIKLNNGQPIQHILGYSYFYGRKFTVNRDVLIPRPETEELVKTGLDFLASKKTPKVLDIGTGSGCIPITMKLEYPSAIVWAIDISELALSVAMTNAKNLIAPVNFEKRNILTEPLPKENFDLIMSNPPYVTYSEKGNMQPQVVDHEPHLALFVPDPDPLLFYRAIGLKSHEQLIRGGMLAVEINYQFGNDVAALFQEQGFTDVKVLKDTSGKDRIVTALK